MTKSIVSIITPLYHGESYLPKLREMIAANANSSKDIAEIEWVIVNDNPNSHIDEFTTKFVKIKIINHKENMGVHLSRIEGVEKSDSEYVVMLDQDDKIESNFIYSQLSSIGDADAVICHVKQNGKDIYENEFNFESIFVKDLYLSNGNSIISPGQVMIRRKSIPLDKWKRHLLTHSGADDHLLWLLMLSENSSFVPNNDLIFERVIDMNNNSFDLENLYLSEIEVVDIVINNNLFPNHEMGIIKKYREKFIKKELRQYSKLLYIISIINCIFSLDNGQSFSSFVREEADNSDIAIYGGGVLCKTMIPLMISNGININCVVDRNYESIDMSVQVVSPEEIPKEVGLVIVTVYEHAKEIKNKLESKFKNKKIRLISELIAKSRD